jgi:hypothetical protein
VEEMSFDVDAILANMGRIGPCAFAFHVLPERIEKDGDVDPDLFAEAFADAANGLLEDHWLFAHQRCRTEPEGIPDAKVLELDGRRFLTITFPPPAGPPEPIYAVIPLDSLDVYTLEAADNNCIFGRIRRDKRGESHDIIGAMEASSLESFTRSVIGFLDGASSFDEDIDVDSQLTRYGAVSRAFTPGG